MKEGVFVEGDGGYWQWRDRLLTHPEGRARGGEPCVQCGDPVPPNAHWVQRDRHVCSPRCNSNLSRRFGRALRSGRLPELKPDPRPNPRTAPRPTHFATRTHVADDGLPVEFDGYGPLDGDTVERHGEMIVAYHFIPAAELADPIEHAPHGLYAAIHQRSGHTQLWAADVSGQQTRLAHAEVDPIGQLRPFYTPFLVDGRELVWRHEIIRDVTPDGIRDYDWTAAVIVPADLPHPGALWSPAFQARSDQRARISASTGRHARRVRLQDSTVERFDPLEIYDRDDWICRLCHQPIDKTLTWPDLMCASLDHIIPLVALGEHSRDNAQAAHWLCNVRKGAALLA